MLIRPIHPGELATFATRPAQPERNREIQRYITEMIAVGSMRRDWCFVAEQDGRTLGCLAFWTLPGGVAPRDLVFLELPWEGDSMESGSRLLRQTLATARALGARSIGHVVDAPPMWPQWQDFREQRCRVLEHAGFVLARETLRFEWPANEPLRSQTQRLTYRSLAEAGTAAFVDAIRRVSEGTLDRRLHKERTVQGPEAAARSLFDLLRHFEYDPAWWELAYTRAGDLAGLLMPAQTGTMHTIGYIGVTPPWRGRGYSDALLLRAATTLHQAGATTIRTDVDTGNLPMANAFRRTGYRQFATRREYTIDLDDA